MSNWGPNHTRQMALNKICRIILAATGLGLVIASFLVYLLTPGLPAVSEDIPKPTVPFNTNFIHLDSCSNARDPKNAIYTALGEMDRFLKVKKRKIPAELSKTDLKNLFAGCLLGMVVADAYSLAFLHSASVSRD